jgi:hypothetical protein
METIRIKKRADEKGFDFDLEPVFIDLFHLLSIFLADERLASTLQDTEDPLWKLCSYGEREVTRILVNSAIIGRIIDERDGFFLPKDRGVCGELIPDVKKREKRTPLPLREAFNKIIHAEEFELIIENTDKEFANLRPIFILHGKKGRVRWETTLNIVEFIREYTRYFKKSLQEG